MKYSEFKKLMESKGLEISLSESKDWWYVKSGPFVIAQVYLKHTEVFDTNSRAITTLDRTTRRFVAQKCMELAFTDLEDREEEEKYYYRLKGIAGSKNFLIKFKNIDVSVIGPYADAVSEQITFTDAEFEALADDIKSHNWEKIKVDREWSEMD